MAVSSVKLAGSASGNMASGNSGPVPLAGNYVSRYLVTCDNPSDTPDLVLRYFQRATSLPWIGSYFRFANGFDRLSVCRNVDVRTVDGSGGHFIVEANFQSITQDEEDNNGNPQNPLDWHDEIEVSYSQQAIPVEKAKFQGFSSGSNTFMPSGKELPITNSARVPLDPPLDKEIDIKVIRITKTTRTFDDDGNDKYNGTVNKDRVVINKPAYGFRTTIEPYKGRIKVVGGSFNIENKVRFWKQVVEVHINPLGWRKEVLDLGLDELYKSGETLPTGGAVNATTTNNKGYLYSKILGRDGSPVTAPMLLDGKGKQLTPFGSPVYGTWAIYDEISWAGIRW